MSSVNSPLPELFPSSLMSSGADQGSGGDDGLQVFDRLRTILSDYLDNPHDSSLWEQMIEARRTAVDVILKFPRKETQAPLVDDARQLVRDFSGSGTHDRPVSLEDLAIVQAAAKKGWQGLLAGMLVTPAWQWADAPLILSVPDWLRADYVSWLFAAPQGFSEMGQAEAYAAFTLRRLEELVRWVDRCPGANVEAEVLGIYASQSSVIPVYFSSSSLRRHAELRGRLMLRALRQPDDHYDAPIIPRAGRRLRVGILNRHFSSQTETYCTLPTFEQLDPERFEVILFCHQTSGSALEAHCRARTSGFVVLPEDFESQLSVLRSASLDVVVIGTNITAVYNDVLRLALHRLAPLQVINNSSCITSGLPDSDMYVSGALTELAEATGHFTERLGLIPGPTHAFNYEADRQEPQAVCQRSDFGIPDDAFVFVSAANYFKIVPEMQHAWAKLLASVPGSRLLVHPFNPNWSSSYPIKRFRAEFERVLANHGVDPKRLSISTISFPSRTDVKTLLALGNVYLDSYPFGGVNSLVDPLELGMPVVTWEGDTMRARMGGSLLRSLELNEMIAGSEAAYHRIAVKLATDPAYHQELAGRIRATMERMPVFLDSLASSEMLGSLLETSFDELATKGRESFRKDRNALRVPSVEATAVLDEGNVHLKGGRLAEAKACAIRVLGVQPVSPAARKLMGRVLTAQGRSDRAVAYLLAALQHDDSDAMLWYDLARALRQNNQMEQTIQAVEGCLRVDPQCLDGWLFLIELSSEANNLSLLDDALAMAKRVAPQDSRVVEWAARRSGNVATGGMSTAAQADTMPKAKHILLYSDDPEFGGVAQWNHNILLALAKAGYRLTCVQTRCDSPLVKEREAVGIRHQWLDYDTGKEFARTLQDRTHAERIFQADRPDLVIFADCCPLSNLAARQVALDTAIPYVTVVHFVGEYLARNFAAYLPALAKQHTAARAVIAVSKNNLDLLRQHFGTPANHGVVIHNGRPPRFFAPIDPAVRQRLRAEQNIPADAVVCFTAARLTEIKGFAYQIEAIKLLKKKMGLKNLYFVWAGDGDQRVAMTKQISELGVQDHVRLLGHRWDIADWYDAADIFVLPSQLEGMPLSIMEAMAKGVPVIATAVSGTPEELGDTGKLLPNPLQDGEGVIRELAKTIEAWAKDSALRAEQGRLGKARAEELFRESLMVERTLALVGSQLKAANA